MDWETEQDPLRRPCLSICLVRSISKFWLEQIGMIVFSQTLLQASCIMSECSLMSDADLLRHFNQLAELFVDFLMHKK